MRYYRISEPDLRKLLMAAFNYWALESGGVDNWEWYSEAIHSYIDDTSVIDFVHYENMEEIVESALCNYKECHCPKSQMPTFDELVEETLPF